MNSKSKIISFLKVFSFILAILNSLAYFAMRNCWSGMSNTLGYTKSHSLFILWLPVALCFIFFFTMLSEILFLSFKQDGKKWPVVYTIVEAVFSIVIFVVIRFGGQKYVRFATPRFLKSLAIAAAVLFIYWLLYKYPESKLKECRAFKATVVGLLIIASMGVFMRFGINRLTYEPVVYAVEDEYQIVFSGATKSLGSVIIDGTEYYDLYNGSERSQERVHKVCVPMEVLDNAGKYTITLQHVWYRGPFGGILGGTIEKEYNFKPIDTSDGFKYLGISDIHADTKGTLKTASYVDNCDLLVIDGDSLSMIDAYRDANYINMIAHEITGGEYPVVYARGNHECKGAYAEELYKYVGSKNGSFYYNVHLGDIYCLVLDLGEDHDDDWWEYYTTAHFDEYKAEQVEFLKAEMEKGDYKKSEYNMVVAHIPVVFVNSRHNHEAIKAELTDILNKMKIDMNLCAHQHDVFIFEPGLIAPGEELTYNPDFKEGTYKGYLTDFNFWSLMLSKPGYTQNPSDEDNSSHVCLVVEADFETHDQKCYYLNANGEKLHVVNPFYEKDYGEEILIDGSMRDALPEKADITLRDYLGEKGIMAGTCISQGITFDKLTSELVKEQFNSVTCENEMKPDYIFDKDASKKAGNLVVKFDKNALKLMQWAKDNNMQMRGHTLIWHSQTPDWIFHEDFDMTKPYVTREVMLERMDSYIKQVFEEIDRLGYTDMFYAYDVVNEAIEDNGSLRKSKWYQIIGEDYIWYAFYYADKYAPKNIDLFYNDYNEQNKAKQVADLAKTLVADDGHSLIDGLGMQAHLFTNDDLNAYLKAVETYGATGLKIHITELDVGLGGYNKMAPMNEENLNKQGRCYYNLLKKIYELKASGKADVESVTVWGAKDNLSWRKTQYPLLFDAEGKAKNALFGVLQDVDFAGFEW